MNGIFNNISDDHKAIARAYALPGEGQVDGHVARHPHEGHDAARTGDGRRA